MKKILTLVLLLPFLSMAQVGVNTTNPKAALDIESTNNGVLIPRVQLTSILDITTVINPNLGPLEISTLVYNIAAAGVVPNDVVAGFYYWNGSQWISIAGSAASDHDWYEVGTTLAPNAITDDIFHTGNVAIGKNTADYPLEVNTTNFQFGMNNTYNNPTVTNTQKATINNNITDNTNDAKYGVINTVTNNSVTSAGVGVRNAITGNGTVFYGNSNYLTAGSSSNNADIIGVRNDIEHNANNSNIKGVFNIFRGTAGNINYFNGVQNDFRVSGLRKTGVENIFNANTDGFNVGLYNSLSANLALNDQYGIWNNFDTGPLTNADNYGVYNVFTGLGSSSKIGNYTRIDSDGDGQHTAAVQLINGSAVGTGAKYGTFTQISNSAGGTHYGIHSTVLKPGATNFAGYFLGNVGIGTTTANTYTFPPSRGTNGQIMQTDGSGNVTWQNPSNTSWSLTGNSGTIPSTASFGTPILAGQNFVGTTDNQDLVFGTNNFEKMRISGFNIGIGIINPTARIDMFDQGSLPSFRINKLSAGGDTTCIDITTTGPPFMGGTKIAAIFRALNGLNNYAIVVPANSGQVGIGTSTPTTTLHVENPTAGALRIVDGTQASGRVLTSDVNGVATWQSLGTLGTAWTINGNSAITTPTVPVTYGTSVIGAAQNFMGTTNANAVVFGTNNIERMRVLSTGNIGIGLATAPAKLSIFGGFLSPTIPNTTTNAMLRIGNNTEGLDIGKAGSANNFASWLQSGFNGNTDPLSLQPLGGNVGIGTTNPSNLLHVNSASSGAVRIVDGTQAAGRVLTSNATGVGTWQSPGIENIIGTLDATGVSLPFSLTTNFVQTNSSITLPPGRYAVNVTMLLARNSSTLPSPPDSFFWVRSTFSDSNAANPLPSPDIVGSSLASGNFGGTSVFAMLTGTIIINNTTAGNKIYYYVGGRCVTFSTAETLTGFGSTSWAENSIIAYRLN
jgi:hypothetical protein